VGPVTDLDAVGGEKSLAPAGNRSMISPAQVPLYLVTKPTELSWLLPSV
jgi:hypothetical protein